MLRFDGVYSFVGVAVQLLLRLPPVALWLSQHVLMCDLDRCFVCALWRSSSSLGSGRGSEVPALLAQLGDGGFLFEAFCDGRSHSAAGFLREYLLVYTVNPNTMDDVRVERELPS